jgi:tetratricopeptide (TPR) repeat protein
MNQYFLQIIFFILSPLLMCQSLGDFISKGDDAYKKFDLLGASKYFEEAYKFDPDNYYSLLKISRIYNDLGEDYYEIKDKNNAEIVVNKAVKYSELFASKFPDSAKVYAILALSYGNLALFKGGNEKIKLAYKIKENAEKSIRLNPNDYFPYIILSIYNRQIASLSWFERTFANIFFGKVPAGSLEESEQLMLKALEIHPEIVIAMFHLSLTYEEMGNETKEIEWLKKVVDAPITDFRDKYAKRKARDKLSELL